MPYRPDRTPTPKDDPVRAPKAPDTPDPTSPEPTPDPPTDADQEREADDEPVDIGEWVKEHPPNVVI